MNDNTEYTKEDVKILNKMSNIWVDRLNGHVERETGSQMPINSKSEDAFMSFVTHTFALFELKINKLQKEIDELKLIK